MLVSIIGGSKTQKKYAQSIVEYCASSLMPRMTTLDISLHLCKPDGALGYCLETDDNRTFEIEIDKTQSLRDVLITICHEMVHVKQYARGELYESTLKGMHRWKGSWMKKDPDYWDQPWEIEAMGRELGLFVKWVEKENLAKYKWTQI